MAVTLGRVFHTRGWETGMAGDGAGDAWLTVTAPPSSSCLQTAEDLLPAVFSTARFLPATCHRSQECLIIAAVPMGTDREWST